MTHDQIRNMMMKMDANFDGHITREELHIAMRHMGSNPAPYVQSYQPIQGYQYANQRPTVIHIKGNNISYM